MTNAFQQKKTPTLHSKAEVPFLKHLTKADLKLVLLSPIVLHYHCLFGLVVSSNLNSIY